MAEENILPKDAMQDVLGVRRDESMGKKVREAAVEWVSYTIVIGDMPHRPIYTPKLMNKRARYY